MVFEHQGEYGSQGNGGTHLHLIGRAHVKAGMFSGSQTHRRKSQSSVAPLGRPSRFPLALAAASPSLVRSEIRSSSPSANNPNRAIITLVRRSCFAVELDRLLDGDEVDLAPDQGLHDLDHLTEAAAEPRQRADQQTGTGLQRPQNLVDAAFKRTLARRNPGYDELVDRESAFLAELEDR